MPDDDAPKSAYELAMARLRKKDKDEGVVEVFEPYELGEVSFHLGWTLHRAGPNTTGQPRKVHTIAYMDKDMPLHVSDHPDLKKECEAWVPGGKDGDPLIGPRTHLLYSK